MPSDFDTEVHFTLEKGKRDSDRMVQDCLDGLTLLLHDQYVQVQGKGYRVAIVASKNGRIMFDIRDLPGFDHIEFCIEKTGWGRMTTTEIEDSERRG